MASKMKTVAKEDVPDADKKEGDKSAPADWWKSMTPDNQKHYLSEHPTSKYADAIKKHLESQGEDPSITKNEKEGGEKPLDDGEKLSKDEDGKPKVSKEEPDLKPGLDPDKVNSIGGENEMPGQKKFEDNVPEPESESDDKPDDAESTEDGKETPAPKGESTPADKTTTKTPKKALIKKSIVQVHNTAKNLVKQQKEFYKTHQNVPGSEARRTVGQLFKDKAVGIYHGMKHEGIEMGQAVKAMAKLATGHSIEDHERKAIVSVCTHVAMTAIPLIATHGTSLLAAPIAHVAGELAHHFAVHVLASKIGHALTFAALEVDENAEEEQKAIEGLIDQFGDYIENADIPDEEWNKAFDATKTHLEQGEEEPEPVDEDSTNSTDSEDADTGAEEKEGEQEDEDEPAPTTEADESEPKTDESDKDSDEEDATDEEGDSDAEVEGDEGAEDPADDAHDSDADAKSEEIEKGDGEEEDPSTGEDEEIEESEREEEQEPNPEEEDLDGEEDPEGWVDDTEAEDMDDVENPANDKEDATETKKKKEKADFELIEAYSKEEKVGMMLEWENEVRSKFPGVEFRSLQNHMVAFDDYHEVGEFDMMTGLHSIKDATVEDQEISTRQENNTEMVGGTDPEEVETFNEMFQDPAEDFMIHDSFKDTMQSENAGSDSFDDSVYDFGVHLMPDPDFNEGEDYTQIGGEGSEPIEIKDAELEMAGEDPEALENIVELQPFNYDELEKLGNDAEEGFRDFLSTNPGKTREDYWNATHPGFSNDPDVDPEIEVTESSTDTMQPPDFEDADTDEQTEFAENGNDLPPKLLNKLMEKSNGFFHADELRALGRKAVTRLNAKYGRVLSDSELIRAANGELADNDPDHPDGEAVPEPDVLFKGPQPTSEEDQFNDTEREFNPAHAAEAAMKRLNATKRT